MVATFGRCVFDFFDETLRHHALRKELDSLVVHAGQQFFAPFVDEADIRQIHHQRDFAVWARLPAFIQFINTRPRKLAFQKKPRRR